MELASLVPVGIASVGGLIGYGVLKGDATALRRDVDKKADKETVDVQYQAILRELQGIKERLDR